jgi:hypothetical protein
MTAFHDFARSHLHYTQQTTADRLNLYGIPSVFSVGDKVKIYMPPTHAQMQNTGRKAKHIIAWRGPCTISRVLSESAYEMLEDCSSRLFARTFSFLSLVSISDSASHRSSETSRWLALSWACPLLATRQPCTF